jgi:hypothetical protein
MKLWPSWSNRIVDSDFDATYGEHTWVIALVSDSSRALPQGVYPLQYIRFTLIDNGNTRARHVQVNTIRMTSEKNTYYGLMVCNTLSLKSLGSAHTHK